MAEKEYKQKTSKYWTAEELHLFNIEHLFRAGDDGIPNIRSSDESIVENIRQKPIASSLITKAANSDDIDSILMEEYGSQVVRNFHRNRTLIDFDYIPGTVREEILSKYESAKPSGMRRQKFLNYLVKNKMAALAEAVGDF